MDGHYFTNPFSNMSSTEIECSKDAMEEVKAELQAFVQTIADRNIEGFDVGEFSAYIDTAITDTIDGVIGQANDAMEDQL